MESTGDQRLGLRIGEWVDVGPADLAEHELRALQVEKRYLLLSRHQGRVCAIDDQCNHAGCLLSGGWVDGKKGAVVCPCHEVAFELQTGRNITVPRLCEDQDPFVVKEEGGRVLLRLGGGHGR